MEITWDEWMVPTIVGSDHEDVVYGLGFAQAQTNAREVLQCYGVARGRAAALWGEAFVGEDVFGAELGLTGRLDQWVDAQDAQTIRRIEAFCAGFNAACEQEPRLGVDRRDVLPVMPRDVLAHHLRTMVRFSTIDIFQRAWPPETFTAGSNAWAISADRSTTGGAMLMINPHLAWDSFQRWFESHTISPGRDFHGASLLGMPWHNLGYNPFVGWGHTVNAMPTLTVYELEVEGDTYRYGDDWLPFGTKNHNIEVRDGVPVHVTERWSVHGPVRVAPDGQTVAVRIAGVLEHPVPTTIETWWQFSMARTVEELIETQDRLPLTHFNLIAADHCGSVGAIYCGTPPETTMDYAQLQGRLRGDDPSALWTRVHPASSMPRVINPPIGWVQSCNEAPWFFSSPPLDETRYPADIAPAPNFPTDLRFIASRTWLKAREEFSPEDLLALKFTKHSILADIVVDDLIRAAELLGGLDDAAMVLRGWDRRADSTSAGYILFLTWVLLSVPQLLADQFLVPAEVPGDPQLGLQHPEQSAEVLTKAVQLMQLHDLPLTASIGDVLTFGEEAIPADGGSGIIGILKSLEINYTDQGPAFRLGDSFIALVEFHADRAATGRHLLPYGNITEPHAPAARSQLPLWAADELRPGERER